MTPTTAYRRDIDGLRALAIVPVVLFHTRVPGFGGGYVGVDIFFVISGFLITGIISREIDEGRFSMRRFYERRARRILPALLLVLIAVLGVASWLFLPGDFEGVPRSALMTLGFLANVWFFAKSGYFAGPAETMPLLHCWSLAVEEQFYVVFPVLLWLCARRAPRWRIALVLAIALASLGLAWWKQADTDGVAFYLLPARAWELMSGALLALGAVPTIRPRAAREVLALAGLGMIAAVVALYDRHTTFPGINAIPPVLGAVLLIHCAPGTLVGRLLSSRLPVGIGLISYSLYLWHWPVIVFADYATDTRVAGVARVAVIAGAFALAYASWRWVEAPFRDARRFDALAIARASVAGMAVVAGIALIMVPLGAWPGRFAPAVNRLIVGRDDFSPRRMVCLSRAVGGDRPECTFGAAVPPTTVLWGDSHGVELAWALGENLGRSGKSVMQRTRASCPPVAGYDVANDSDCARFNDDVLQRILANPSLHHVYIAAFWASPAYNVPGMADRITATIVRLRGAGRDVTVIGPVPPQPFEVPRRLAHAAALGRLATVQGGTLADYRAETGWFTRNYSRWRALGVTIVDPLSALTVGDRTRLMIGDRSAYFDWHHLSLTGARAVLATAPAP